MNQVLENPYPYSNDNKRYYTFNYYLKSRYHQKAAKIPLDAGFTCPNRDGTKSSGGCAFCSAAGSGDTILARGDELNIQFQKNLERARKKWPNALAIAYFQSYTNTYAPLEVLKELYLPFLNNPEAAALSIATRADCLSDDFLDWLSQNRKDKEVWIEIGLQSIHEKTALAMNRAHTSSEVQDALERIRKAGLKSVVHIINGLPGESEADMLETAKAVAKMKPDAIKIHMLHLLENTRLGAAYKLHPFPLLSLEQYVKIVCDQLEILPEDMIIERVSGDGVAEDLIAPKWTIRKTVIANEIDKELLRRNSWQGKYYRQSL